MASWCLVGLIGGNCLESACLEHKEMPLAIELRIQQIQKRENSYNNS